jgi:hypothetical protein
MNQAKWTYTRNQLGIGIKRFDDGHLIAIVYDEAYAPQIAATPDLYDALDALTDVACSLPDGKITMEWVRDLQQATRNGIEALAKARGCSHLLTGGESTK